MMEEKKYFSRSWALLTRDKGWIKPLLVMTAAAFVPIAGPLGNKGYALEWARLTAWGVDSAPKQRNVDIGGCIASGWRGFVVDLGLGLAAGIILSLVTLVFSVLPGILGALLGSVVSFAMSIVSAALSVALIIAEIRAAIYERIGAGYRVDRIWEMIKRDPSGFGRVFLVSLACSAVIGVIVTVFVFGILAIFAPVAMLGAGYADSQAMLAMFAGLFVPMFMIVALFVLVMMFLGNAVTLLVTTSAALWMRQFDVASWGRSEDPLPDSPIAQQEAPATSVLYGDLPPYEPEVSQPEPQPEPEFVPEPMPVSEPVPVPEYVSEPAHMAQEIPEADPAPQTETETEAVAQTVAETDFEPSPVLEPEPEPEPEPEHAPEPLDSTVTITPLVSVPQDIDPLDATADLTLDQTAPTTPVDPTTEDSDE